ncbi:MAG: MFS transporter, partial [Phycisphaerales bacterium]
MTGTARGAVARSTASGLGAAKGVDAISRRAWQTLAVTSISTLLASMDVTIVGVALPGITRSFAETPASTLAWVFTAYNVTFAALLLLGGKLSDRFGPKRTFLCGLAVFTVASLMAALAPNAAVLIAARACKAVGSALIYPASIALLLQQFPPTRRSLGIGVLGGVSGLGGVIAPTLGSLLVQLANWRAVFFIYLPVTFAARLLGA